jgi:uncharacterized protein
MSGTQISNVAPLPPQHTNRGKQIDGVLVALTGMRGVTAAAVVDSDGLVTHIRRDFDVDTDALGAAVQITYGAASRASQHVRHGAARVIISENNDGMVLLAPLSKGFMLAVITDSNAMLGAVRFEIKESVQLLNQALGG